MSYYAVARGKSIGIFSSWNDCQEQVKGFKGAIYKKFTSQKEAEEFITEKTGPSFASSKKSDVTPEKTQTNDSEMGNQLRIGMSKSGSLKSHVQLSRTSPVRAGIRTHVCRELHEAKQELVS